jgi:hypothetical protein
MIDVSFREDTRPSPLHAVVLLTTTRATHVKVLGQWPPGGFREERGAARPKRSQRLRSRLEACDLCKVTPFVAVNFVCFCYSAALLNSSMLKGLSSPPSQSPPQLLSESPAGESVKTQRFVRAWFANISRLSIRGAGDSHEMFANRHARSVGF